MQVSEHVYMLEIAGQYGVIYPALIHQGRELILVDAGYPLQTEAIKGAIAEAGFAAEKLTYILLTHQDLDHIGCAKELVALSGAQVGCYELEAPYIQGEKTPVKLARQEAAFPSLEEEARAWVRTMRDAYERRKLLVDLWFKDGEILPVCGGIEVIHTPGHTPGHACYYVMEDEIMIAGDTLNVQDGALTGADPRYSADPERAAVSNARLGLREVGRTIAYHGGLFEGGLREALQGM